MIKRCLIRDSTDSYYHFGFWEAPGDGWTEEEWIEAIYNVRNVDRVYWEVVDAHRYVPGEMPIWNELVSVVECDGYPDILAWLYPELKQLPFTELWA